MAHAKLRFFNVQGRLGAGWDVKEVGLVHKGIFKHQGVQDLLLPWGKLILLWQLACPNMQRCLEELNFLGSYLATGDLTNIV